ncbi:MAG TPA: twin-arginine translocase TatA/TatE family subunit [Gammaproteobacteria bacterium]|nr:twin-arginine translocase TatA/TatE family subunit [Gammaproteobacteria bacterium]
MGFGGISIGSLLLIFLIVLVLFGTKKLRTIGEDLGQAVRSFRKGLQEPNHKTESDSDKNLL